MLDVVCTIAAVDVDVVGFDVVDRCVLFVSSSNDIDSDFAFNDNEFNGKESVVVIDEDDVNEGVTTENEVAVAVDDDDDDIEVPFVTTAVEAVLDDELFAEVVERGVGGLIVSIRLSFRDRRLMHSFCQLNAEQSNAIVFPLPVGASSKPFSPEMMHCNV